MAWLLMVQAEDLKRELGKIIITDPVMMKPYATDASYFEGVMPLAVAIPENVEQVKQIMSYCSRNSIRVVARGGGTSLTGS
jgi:glycolate oxidase